MKTTKHGSETSKKHLPSNESAMDSSLLMELFENELKDIYYAEKVLSKAMAKLIKNASEPALIEALETHLSETEAQIGKVEHVFELVGRKVAAKKCEAMAGLIKESEDIIKETTKGAQRDAGIISAAQKIEHYEIATYGTLRTFAETLGLDEAADILREILDEEKEADATLTKVAQSTINVEAMAEHV